MDFREIEWGGMDWIGLIWLRIGMNGGVYEQSNEPSGSITLWKIV
jgi:hypothetical protein